MAFNQNTETTGLSTTTFTAPTAGTYTVTGKLTLPMITAGGPGSQVVCTVNQNGSPVYVGLAGAEGLRAELNCAALDSITIVLSSNLASDSLINVIKACLGFTNGVQP